MIYFKIGGTSTCLPSLDDLLSGPVSFSGISLVDSFVENLLWLNSKFFSILKIDIFGFHMNANSLLIIYRSFFPTLSFLLIGETVELV